MTSNNEHSAANLFPMMSDQELQQLADDIKANGLKIPIVMLDGKVLDGRNRLKACEMAGVKPRFVEHDGGDPWRTVWSLNKERRHITDAIRLALIGEEMIRRSERWVSEQDKARAKTKEAKKEGGKKGGRGRPIGTGSRDPEAIKNESNKTAFRLASELGVSAATVKRAKELRTSDPEKADLVARGEMEGQKALREIKRKNAIAKISEIAKGNKSIDGVCGLASVLYADPPWRYDDNSTDPTRVIENQYPTMSHEDLCILGEQIRGICTKDSILYLWAPPPLLKQAIIVMESWGFLYKTGTVWDKEKIGMGYFSRQQHEHLLVGERGTMPKPEPSSLESSIYREKRGTHSEKPDHYYELLERQYPNLPKRELFARGETRNGWLPGWGNQAS